MIALSQPLIRGIKRRDFREVAEITNRHFPHMRMTPSRISERLSRGFFYLVAIANGAVVGFADVKITRGRAKLMGLAVEDEFRGKGVGSALLSKVIESAIEKGSSLVYLKVKKGNLPAIRVYESHGFVFRKEVEKNGESVYIMYRKMET